MKTKEKFIPPTTYEELRTLKWKNPDVILITGDSYIDSPFIGVAVLARYLNAHGFKTAVIAQPDINSAKDIMRLGEPRLFWGVTAGSLDSMVANYTATGKKRKKCDYTPGGINNKRPDRAVIIYTNLIKRFSKLKKPIVLGGLEASLRRIAHYDFWNNKIRKPILFDSKADYLIYGMAEKPLLQFAKHLNEGKSPLNIKSLCYINKTKPDNSLYIGEYELLSRDKEKYAESFMTFYKAVRTNKDIILTQKCGDRYIVINPSYNDIKTEDLDDIFSLNFTRDQHPYYKKLGDVKALDTIKFSIVTHRGCYGECNFCSITLHQGRSVKSRSINSIIQEVKSLTTNKSFKGTIADIGGPSANMFGIDCKLMRNNKNLCEKRTCLFPEICTNLNLNHNDQITLLKKIDNIQGVKRSFVCSGIRYDMINEDKYNGENYLESILDKHISGQMKIAPEHISFKVLSLMKKPGKKALLRFKEKFEKIKKKLNKHIFLTYYFIAAHPGSTMKDMMELKNFIKDKLKMNPEQIQIFTPTPLTISSLIYWTEKDPFTKKNVFVEKKVSLKEKQKNLLLKHNNRKNIK